MNIKIIIGFAIAFIISLNIYNIPFNQEEKVIEPPEFKIDQTTIDIKTLNKVLSKSLGKNIDLKSYKRAVVTFWATWCPSCHKENIVFNEVVKKNKDLFIIGICVDKNKSALANYQQKLSLNFPVVNINKSIALLFDEISVVPTHFIIDPKDQSMSKTFGLLDKNQLESLTEEMK